MDENLTYERPLNLVIDKSPTVDFENQRLFSTALDLRMKTPARNEDNPLILLPKAIKRRPCVPYNTVSRHSKDDGVAALVGSFSSSFDSPSRPSNRCSRAKDVATPAASSGTPLNPTNYRSMEDVAAAPGRLSMGSVGNFPFQITNHRSRTNDIVAAADPLVTTRISSSFHPTSSHSTIADIAAAPGGPSVGLLCHDTPADHSSDSQLRTIDLETHLSHFAYEDDYTDDVDDPDWIPDGDATQLNNLTIYEYFENFKNNISDADTGESGAEDVEIEQDYEDKDEESEPYNIDDDTHTLELYKKPVFKR